ncbi:MAG TPA: phosphodiester glycosidase family protein [Phycisphaerae bacterium]|nr:phosphodiester glycosidase family protein [Phycisphaerae bacterium]
MAIPELAELMVRQYGVADALNLDGGGSTTLAIADPTPRVVNVPVGAGAPGTQRPVGSNLAIFAQLSPPAGGDTGESPPGPAPFGHMPAACWAAGAVLACLAVGFTLRRRRAPRA